MRRPAPIGAAKGSRPGGIPYVPWNQVAQPGVYVDIEFPRYFRIPAKGVRANSSPVIPASDFTVAKISPDPMLSKQRIQMLCVDYGLPVPK
jgi:hypothetical protein